ncbi:MAG: oligosaccharide flippase family protein [Alysiella sp.]|uniref:oligosaccharide flippase family protein n=1 Tax=Alysiella sp. TaxID=1872483 RepID=UPI0026DCD864|nr:oligosaccharide flippase family protein [Alysiella sp.]MDO4433506.1 oligosaccharide flippase family protein [Alysiella sp.]
MKILKDSLVYLLGEMFAKAMPFLMLPYLTRKLGVAGFGELSFYQACLAVLLIVFGLGQDAAITRYCHFYGQRNLPQLIQAAYCYTAVLGTLALLWVWSAQSLIWISVIAAAMVQAMLSVQLALRQCRKQAIAYTVIQCVSGLLVSFLTILLLEWSENAPLEKRFVAIVLGNALLVLGAYWAFKREKQGRQGKWRFRQLVLNLRYLLWIGLPLLLHQFSGVFKGQFDRLLLHQQFGANDLGVYAAGYQVAAIWGVLLMAVNKATVPYFYQALKSGRLNAIKVRQGSLWSLWCVPVPVLCVLLLPEKLFLWLLGAEFVGIKYFIGCFTLFFSLNIPYFILVNFLFYHAQNSVISRISLISAAVYALVLFVVVSLGNVTYIPFAALSGSLIVLPLLYRSVRTPI